MRKIKLLVVLFVTCVAISKGTSIVKDYTYNNLHTMVSSSNIMMEMPDASAFQVGR